MLYIINDGCCLDWDLAKGPAQQVLFLNLLLAWAYAAYVSRPLRQGSLQASSSHALAATWSYHWGSPLTERTSGCLYGMTAM